MKPNSVTTGASPLPRASKEAEGEVKKNFNKSKGDDEFSNQEFVSARRKKDGVRAPGIENQANTTTRASLYLPMNQPMGAIKTQLVQRSSSHFKYKIPFVAGVDLDDAKKVHLDLFEQYTEHFVSAKDHEIERLSQTWHERLRSMRFLAFFNANTSPIVIGTADQLKASGLETSPFFDSLLIPSEGNPDHSKVLYDLLADIKVLPYETKKLITSAIRMMDNDEVDSIKEKFLVDAAARQSPTLLRRLLELKISPDSYDRYTGLYAINSAKILHREEHVSLLLQYGADANLEPIDNPF